MKINSKANNPNYIDNYDKVFGKQKSPRKIKKTAGDSLTPTGPISIEQLDLLNKATKALLIISDKPELAKNPVIMMAVEHIHEEINHLIPKPTRGYNDKLLAETKESNNESEKALVEAPINTPVETDKNINISGNGKLNKKWKLEKKY